MRDVGTYPYPVTVLLLAASCALGCAGGNAASELASPPAFAPKDQTQCLITASHAKPLVVEWPSADRGELEARVRGKGLVVVEYTGCHMRVLDRCSANAAYAYSPINKKTDHVVMRDTDDLYANVPMGAAKLEAKLQKTGQLDVEMTMVGRWEAQEPTQREDQLSGACDGATHVLSALTVGAFTFSAGADAEVGGEANAFGAGAGAKSTSKRETLSSDGNEHACDKATMGDRSPPDECGALIRVEVVPLVPRNPFVGRWLCSGTVTALSDGSVATVPPAEKTITEDGEGRLLSVGPSIAPCPHRLVVSGSKATLAEPYTCTVAKGSAAITSAAITAASGTLATETIGTVNVAGKASRLAIRTSATCTRVP